MPITVRQAGSLKDLTEAYARQGGTIKTVSEIYARTGGQIRRVWRRFTVNITGRAIASGTLAPADSSAQYLLRSDGTSAEVTTLGGTININNQWGRPDEAGVGADYEVRATLQSGSLTSGTTGSWQNLGSNRSWTVQRAGSSVGTSSAQILVEIRRAGTTDVIDSATITLTAIVETGA